MGGREEADVEYFEQLKNGDTIRVRLNIERGEVTSFTLQLETFVDGQWRRVVRYDSAHDYPHRDILDWDGRVVEKIWLAPGLTNKQAVAQARQDLKEHAAAYRAAFMERKR